MKRILLFISIMLGTSAFAAPVDKQKARNAATVFLQKLKPGTVLQSEPVMAPERKGTAAGQSYYYVFNAKGNNGFVVVSGDDRTNPVIGYSDRGHFDIANMPDNMKSWFAGYEMQFKALEEMDDQQAERVLAGSRKAKPTRNSISPLITTTWDQATPYWNKCPQFMNEDGTSYELAYTGCVATAMAQIMKFHQYPAQTTKEIPPYTFSYPLGNYQYGTATTETMPVVSFDWDHMRDSYTGAEDHVYTDAVATLMVYAGHAVKMQYGTSSSGAYTDDIPKGFTEYFGYDRNTVRIAFRNDYEQSTWDDLIYNELSQGRPMIYNGTAGSGGGHSFVCDGYEYGDYFHINWGWGGMGNGFFLLEILNPNASGIGGSSSSEGYNMKQNAIIGIQPGDGTVIPDTTEVKNVLTLTDVYFNYNDKTCTFSRDSKNVGFSIYKRKVLNVVCSDHMGTGKKYKKALGLYNAAGDSLISIIMETNMYSTVTTSATGDREQFGGGLEARDAVKFGAGMTGTFRIIPMSKEEGSDEWLPMLESDRFYYEIEMGTYDATATAHPLVSLEAVNYEFAGGETVGKSERVSVTLKNNSADRFFGNLYLWVDGEMLDPVFTPFTSTIQAEVPAGGEKVVTFNFTPSSAGTKGVGVSTDDNGEYAVPGQGQITIMPSNEAPMNLSCVIEAENADEEKVIYDSYARFKVDVTNNSAGEYNRYVLAPLFIVNKDEQGNVTGGSMVTYKQATLNMTAGETKTLYFEFENLAYGSTYSLNLYARNDEPAESEASHLTNLVQAGNSVYYDIKRGLVTWTSDGKRNGVKAEADIIIPESAVAASLEGLTVGNVTPNSNPNTLYFIGSGEEEPAGLEESNVIAGTEADEIRLKDGFDFFTPQAFTAASISYERTHEQGLGYDMKGWNTLTLPFAATRVTADGEEIDWFRTEEDADKDFWICDFAEEEGDSVIFKAVGQIVENHPYIIAVPGMEWGADKNLTGKTLSFSAENALVKPNAIAYTSGDNNLFVGTFVKQTLGDILALNAEGSKFIPADDSQTVNAFHAYFVNRAIEANPFREVIISVANIQPPTAITAIMDELSVDTPVYTISGQCVGRLADIQKLPRGIYVVSGKKFVK